jgi:predicted Fe-Mo cluster-binding NifX family protein
MRIAIAADQDYVSSHFGCCPACMIVRIEDNKIRDTILIPNPGCNHVFWADLLQKNSIECLIVAKIGSNALAVLEGRGIRVMTGVEGRILDVIEKYLSGVLHSGNGVCSGESVHRSSPDPRDSKTK